jgi:hypothetical protein
MYPEQTDQSQKGAVAFVDGQNLFHAVKAAFGYSFPNYDPVALAERICRMQGWRLRQTRFYTGMPAQQENPFWHGFWTNKLKALEGRRNVAVCSRELQYRDEAIRLPDGSVFNYRSGHEKGIDVRMAIDLVALAYRQGYDVALVFSQDQDLVEAASEIRRVARDTGRWIKVASAYPHKTPGRGIGKGIDRTDWLPFGREVYDECVDRADYRPAREEVERLLAEREAERALGPASGSVSGSGVGTGRGPGLGGGPGDRSLEGAADRLGEQPRDGARDDAGDDAEPAFNAASRECVEAPQSIFGLDDEDCAPEDEPGPIGPEPSGA